VQNNQRILGQAVNIIQNYQISMNRSVDQVAVFPAGVTIRFRDTPLESE
jgi:hypothetical protein